MSEGEHVLAAGNRLGEGPVWDVEKQTLYWVDIYSHAFHRYKPATGAHDVFQTGIAVGAVAPRANGGFVMATERGFAFWDEQSRQMTFLANPEAGVPTNRCNDGAVDSAGRFWAGTMTEAPERYHLAEGNLYRLDTDRSLHCMDRGFIITNGMGWSPDNTVMYVTDSPRKVIYAYDFDAATGALAHRRPFIHSPDEAGVPDGLTVDSEGYLWSVRWGGWKITRYDPVGQKEREMRLPVQYPTSCAFGGAELDELFITSAWTELNAAQRAQQPQAGDLFHLRPGVEGLPQTRFRG